MMRLLSPILPYVIGGLVALGVVFGIWRAGYNTAWREAQVERLKTEIATLKVDAKISEDARAEAEVREADMARRAEENQRVIAEFKKRLGAGDASRFRLTADDAEWLRRIK